MIKVTYTIDSLDGRAQGSKDYPSLRTALDDLDNLLAFEISGGHVELIRLQLENRGNQ